MARKEAATLRFGKYELLEKIGVGGMAEIYRARVTGPEGFEKHQVVKKILPAYAKNKAFIEMLVAEAKLSSLLHHANVVQIYELGEIEGQYYIAMEYVPGADLLKLLAASTRAKRRIPVDLCLYIVSEMAKGLGYAHQATDHQGRPLRIIHRDVSPSNVLISFDGDVKIMDFGVARADLETTGGRHRKKSGALKGKLGYMSPELVTGGDIDHRSDIFALGIILWEILTLRRLFLGKTDVQTLVNIRDVNVQRKFAKHSYIPDGIQTIIAKALAKESEDRFQTASELQEAILDYLFEHRIRVTGRRLGDFLKEILEADKQRDAEKSKGPPPGPPVDDLKRPERPAAKPAPPGPPPPPAANEDKTDPDVSAQDGADPADTTENPIVPPQIDAEPPPAEPSVPEGEERQSPRAGPPLTDLSQLPAATFRIRGDDGQTFGPVTFHNLEKLIRNRALTEQELISVDSGPWIALADSGLPALAPELFSEELEHPIYEGPLNPIRTPQLMYELAVSKVDGKLKLSRGTTAKEVYFQAGVPVHINSNIRSELLANFLIERKHIEQAQLRQALEHMREEGGRLGDALVSMGVLKPHDLYRVVELQFRQRFLELFRWSTGWYEFLEGYVPPNEVIPLTEDAFQLVTLAARTLYDLGTMKAIFGPYLDQVIVLQQNHHITHHQLRLNSRELRFHTYVETGKTLRETIERCGRSDEDVHTLLQVIFVLHQTAFLTFRSNRGFAPRTA